MTGDNHQEGIVLEQCPLCKRKFKIGHPKRILQTQYAVATPAGEPQRYSFPKIVCTNCGIEFFPGPARIELRKREEAEETKIIPATQIPPSKLIQ